MTISAVLGLFLIVGSHWTLIQTPPIVENQGCLGTEVTVIRRGATTLQTVFVAGDALACVLVEAAGTGLMTHILVQEGLRHTLFARLLMDAVLTHLRASLAHPLHGHVPLGAGFPACSLVQGEASLARVAVGGISFTGSARSAAGLTCAVCCVEALRAPGVAPAFVEDERKVW